MAKPEAYQWGLRNYVMLLDDFSLNQFDDSFGMFNKKTLEGKEVKASKKDQLIAEINRKIIETSYDQFLIEAL